MMGLVLPARQQAGVLVLLAQLLLWFALVVLLATTCLTAHALLA